MLDLKIDQPWLDCALHVGNQEDLDLTATAVARSAPCGAVPGANPNARY